MIRRGFRFLISFLFPQKIEEKASEVSGKLEVSYANGRYVLDTVNVNYSFGGLHSVFQKVFSQFNIRERNIKNVLILGFGSGSVASILQDEYGKAVEITAVEKDEAVIELSRKYFQIDKYKNLRLHCADAYDFITDHALPVFDLIVVDIFIDLYVPEKFQDEKFISAVNKLLSPNGILFYNFIARDERTRDQGAKLFRRIEKIGPVEWVRLFANRTENWVFVCDLSSEKIK